MTVMSIDNNPLTQRRLPFIGISVNKLTLKSINIIQSPNNYNKIVHMKILDTSFKMTKRRFRFIVTPIVGVCNCSMFCCTLLYVHSSIAIILMGKRELIALLGLSSWCLVVVGRLFLAAPRGCLQFVIVVFPDHTHLLF